MAYDQRHRDGFASGDRLDDRIQLTLAQVRTLRTRRGEFFDADLFSDPAWDILLLLANAPERTGFGVAQIAESLGHPLSVTDRWLKILASKGQIEIAGQGGGGIPLYRIADRAFEALVNVFAGMCEAAPDQAAG